MTFQNPRPEIYDPKTLAVMDQAFAAIWNVLRADDPFRDYAKDSELRLAIGHKWAQADGASGEWGDRSCSAWIPHPKEPASAHVTITAFNTAFDVPAWLQPLGWKAARPQ
jgi:hypothetical protein